MPPLTMRGRYLMREFWSDSDLFRKLEATEREVYVGLWMLADDAGWMPRDVPAIAAALYRYEDGAPREARVRAVMDHLRTLGKLESHRCCIFLPAVARYPRAGKKSLDHEIAHRAHGDRTRSNGDKPIQTDSNPSPVPSLPDPSSPDVPPGRASSTPRAGSVREIFEASGGFAAEIASRDRAVTPR